MSVLMLTDSLSMEVDTTAPSYWLNWRFFLCALFILMTMVLASIVILKYEEFNKWRNERREMGRETIGSIYEDEQWNTCLKEIHPALLLAYRIICFLVLLSLLTVSLVADGGAIFFFYTVWTVTLVTIYFGLGSCISVYGCFYKHNKIEGSTVNSDANQVPHTHNKIDSSTVNCADLDAEQDTYVNPTFDGIPELPNLYMNSNAYQESPTQNTAGVWGYIFQIIFQTCAGSGALTDIVFWLILYPSLKKSRHFHLRPLDVCMHSFNTIFLLGEVSLNCMRFPVFRFAYFILWTDIYVIFQWIIHACVSLGWPYHFLDLSSPYAPLWYLGVGAMHIPCYGVFVLTVKLKHRLLSKWFPGSCQFVR